MSDQTVFKSQKKSFADIGEVIEIETLPQESLQQYEKDAAIKFAVTLKTKPSVRLGKKRYTDVVHVYAKIADVPGLKVGDSCVVKGRVSEGGRYLSDATLEIIKK